MSGAGLKSAVSICEDSGADCVDNLPVEMVESAAELMDSRSHDRELPLVFALRMRDALDIDLLLQCIRALESKYRVDHLFLYAQSESLVHRFRTNRRKHPLQVNTKLTLEQAIAQEARLLAPVRECAADVIDTSLWAPQQLVKYIENRYSRSFKVRQLVVELVSFGFKYGVPPQVDGVYDVRFLKNPHFDMNLRHKTGLETDVQEYVMKDGRAVEFMEMLCTWLQWVLPHIYEEGRRHYRLAIGCTGGQHRSVTIVEKMMDVSKNLDCKFVFSRSHYGLSSRSLSVAAKA